MTIQPALEWLVEQSFNPCFSGSYIMTFKEVKRQCLTRCFNPCFSGSYIMTKGQTATNLAIDGFQSLF